MAMLVQHFDPDFNIFKSMQEIVRKYSYRDALLPGDEPRWLFL